MRVQYPVEHVGPALHGDALEHRQHGEEKVVKVGDAVVGAVPPPFALRAVHHTVTAVTGKRTRQRVVIGVVL